MAKAREEAQSRIAVGEYQKQWRLYLDRKRQTAYIHRVGNETVKEIPSQK